MLEKLRTLHGTDRRDAVEAIRIAQTAPERGRPTLVSGAEPGDRTIRVGVWIVVYGTTTIGVVVRFLHRVAI